MSSLKNRVSTCTSKISGSAVFLAWQSSRRKQTTGLGVLCLSRDFDGRTEKAPLCDKHDISVLDCAP